MASDVRVGVLVSGTGTILEAILSTDLPVAVVVADRPCRALEITRSAGVPAELVDRAEFGGYGAGFERERYTEQVVEILGAHRVALVVMAGFGTILSQSVHDAFPRRILNTHPSLLPVFPGWHSVRDALDAGVDVTGCTVHFATLETDAGPVIAQEEVRVLPGDTEETLHERIKQTERRLYPATIRKVVDEMSRDRSFIEEPSRIEESAR